MRCTAEGEKELPIPDSPAMSYDRWQRYLYAARFSEGAAVLDLACGDGYGSYLLSLNAQTVIGVDMREEKISHAASRYIRDNLQFKVGSAARIPIEGTEVFDLIVFFEATEHISNDEQHALMVEVRRLLKKDGLFIVSSPNKISDTDLPRCQHGFHDREFDAQEFKEFLEQYFPHVGILAQKPSLVSDIWSLGIDQGQVSTNRPDWTESGPSPTGREREILFRFGLCSEKPIDVHASTLVESNERFSIHQAGRIAELESALRGKEVRLAELEAGVTARDAKIADLEYALGERDAYIQHVHSGRGWRLLTGYFKVRERLLPQGTKRRLLAKNILHIVFSAAVVSGRIGNEINRLSICLRNLLFKCPPTILMVTHVRFYPPAAGNELRIFNLIKFLKKRGYQIAVLVNPLSESAPLDPERRRKIHEFVDYYEEMGDFDSHHISSTGFRPITTEPILERWRHQEQALCPDAVLWRTSELIKRLSPRVILSEYIWTSSVLKLAPAGTLRVIDLIDMFSSKAKNVNSYGFDDPLATSADEEKAFLNRADLVIAIQDTEAAAFRKLEPTCRVIVAGIDFDVAVLADFSERVANPPFVLIVASNNPFNVRCVREFIEQAWPIIRERVPRMHSTHCGQGVSLPGRRGSRA